MLNKLHVQNFALIEDLKLNLEKGLNIITGETGAGKSILLGALGLLSGKRADISIVRAGTKKCVVEGEFLLGAYGLNLFFNKHDLDIEEVTIIRREISVSGKSRAFVNDSPVNLAILKELGDQIIDVHSQHSNLLLANPKFSFQLLDGFACQQEKVKLYQKKFSVWIESIQTLKSLEEKQQQEQLNLEFHQFQLNELTTAELKEGEQEMLETEFEVLNNAEDIRENASIVANGILYNKNSVQEVLQNSKVALSKLAAVDGSYTELESRLTSGLIELKDIAEEVEQKSRGISSDVQRVNEIDDRLSVLFGLQKKYIVASVEDLITKREELKQTLDLVEGGDEQLEILKSNIITQEKGLIVLAEALTKKRIDASKKLAKEVIGDLKLMGITEAQLQFDISKMELNQFGCDKIDFLFTANKGNQLGSLSKTASGGELSRVMLSLKRLMSSKTALPTIVFDEIDTGVSGEVADQMGDLMKKMGVDMQVLTITHLPQIAAKGNAHYKVYKSHDARTTSSQIKSLSNSERVDELAQMLSGTKITEASRQNAMELLK